MTNTITPKLKVGDVIFVISKRIYYKITWVPEPFPTCGKALCDPSYRVIKCNSKGKSFTETNSLDVYLLDKNIFGSSSHYKYIGNFSDAADVSRDGINSGKMKRRISFLEARIKSDTKEMESLRGKLFAEASTFLNKFDQMKQS
jgi:hypothetical protein